MVCNLNVLFKLWNLKGKPYSRNDAIFRIQGYIYETTQFIIGVTERPKTVV